MPALEDYILAMEAAPEETIAASGLIVAGCDALASGTSGVTTACPGLALPPPIPAATASWRPAGLCRLPLPATVGATASWRPAWGAPVFPGCVVFGEARVPSGGDIVLAPLFSMAGAGAAGRTMLPPPDVAAAMRLPCRGDARLVLPAFRGVAHACGLESPVTTAAGQAAVVALLCRDDPDLARAAGALAAGAVGDDAVAGALLAAVAGNLAYVADGAGSDVWTCAAGTYFRGSGDCEDGAILLQALLLAAGIPADRLVTAFGRVGLDRKGHAWVGYRRRSDGRWTVLDWTRGPSQGPVAGLPALDEPDSPALVDYALTAGAFFAVRQDAAAFFSRCAAEALILPRLAVAGTGALGADAAFPLPPSPWTGLGRCGARGSACAPVPACSGTAGSVAGLLGLVVPAIRALSGGVGAMRLPRPEAAAGGAGGGMGVLALPGGRVAAAGRVGLLAASGLVLAGARGSGIGLAGEVGGGQGRLPRARLDSRALPGMLARGRPALPRPAACGAGGPELRGACALRLASCAADGAARPGPGVLADYVWKIDAGEEWA